MAAALTGDVDSARALIGAGARVNAADRLGRTALMIAAYFDHYEIVRSLLDAGADPSILASDRTTALGSAVSRGRTGIVLLLLESGADANTLMPSGAPVLENAAVNGNLGIVEALIAHAANLDSFGVPALRAAAWKGHSKVAEALISAGVDANGGEPSPLNMAIQSGDLDTVELLLAHGAGLDASTRPQEAPLYTAISPGNARIVEALLAHGSGPSYEDLLTALSLWERDREIAPMLIERADVRSLSRPELDNLLVAAEQVGAERIVGRLLGAVPPVDDRATRLLLARTAEPGCSLVVWEPTGSGETTVFESESSCPERVFMTDDDTVLLIEDNSVQVVPIDGEKPRRSFELPEQELRAPLAELRAEVRESYDRDMGLAWMNPEPVALGFLDTDAIGLALHLRGPADEIYAYLFGRSANAWELLAQKDCIRFDPCVFPEIDGRAIDDWPDERAAWHPYLRQNPYFLGSESAPGDGASTRRKTTLRFNIEGNVSTVKFGTAADETTGRRVTISMELRVDDGDTVSLMKGPGASSFAGRYVLIHPAASAAVELFDLQTGRSVFGPLAAAAWM